jgi:hypothetical protein
VTTVARRFASTPRRTATDTWTAIVELLAPDPGAARDELDQAAGVISMLIADEATRDRPLVVSGTGPQVRVYTVHGEDAVEGTNVTEAALAANPTAGPWTLTVPVPDDDAEWVDAAFAELPHITRAVPTTETKAAARRPSVPVVDMTELRS